MWFQAQQAPPAAGSSGGFDATTKMLFVQTAAPTGWTKDTDQNDKALRIVSGAASTGGTSAFSTVFGKTATDNFTLTTAHLAAHTHTVGTYQGTNAVVGANSMVGRNIAPDSSHTSSSAGSGTAHSHGMDIRIQYVDVIKATKD